MANIITKLALLMLLASLVSGRLIAQEEPEEAAPAATSAEESDKGEADEEDDEGPDWLHVHHVDVYPVVGPVLRGGEILIRNGKIHAIGRDLEVPEGAETLDAGGLRAYPGMVALNGQGIVPSPGGAPENSADPNGLWTILGLSHGITTVITGTTAVKLIAGTVDDYVLRKDLYVGLFYSTRNPAAKRQLEEDLRKVWNFLRRKDDPESAAALRKKREEEESKDEAKPAPSGRGGAQNDGGDAAARKALGSAARYLKLMKGEQVGVFNVNGIDEIRDACRLVETFGFTAVLRGVVEGWTDPGALGRAGVTAIVTPRVRQDPDDDTNRPNGSTMENASILHRHGVPVAIATLGTTIDLDGQPGRDAISVAWSAGAAVRGGLPEDAAIRGVTITAARAYGLDDRVGSLEVGKDADLVIVDGELLHYETMVQWAIVNGRIVYDKAEEPLLRHIRPRDPELAKRGQWWPRPFGEMPDTWSYDPAAVWAEKEKAREKDESSEKKEGEEKPKDEKKPADESKPADEKKPAEAPAGGGSGGR